MPINILARKHATQLSREITTLAGHIRALPKDRDASAHPEIRAALASFKRINAHLASGRKAGALGARRQAAIAREFHKIGGALGGRKT